MIRIIFALFFFLSFIPLALSKNASSEEMKQLLELTLEELMEVEITTAGRVAEKIGEIPASIVLITRQDIETYGYSSLNELLEHISGMYKNDTYSSSGQNYGVRGYWSTTLNRNLIILVNGVKQLSDHDLNYPLEYLVPIEAIDRIEIVRGPMSVIYGTGAFFGAINIITNDMTKDSPQYRISAGLGGSLSSSKIGEQTYQAFARIQHAYENGKFTLNASTYNTDGFDYPYSELASQLMAPAIGKTTKDRLENQRHHINLSANYKNLTLELTHVNSEKEWASVFPTTGPGHSRSAEVTRIQLSYRTNMTDRFSIEAKLGHTDTEANPDYIDTDIVQPGTSGWQIVHSRSYEAELTGIWQPTDDIDVVTGITYHRTTRIFDAFSIPVIPNASEEFGLEPGNDLITWGAFTQLSYRLNERWKWISGIRLQQTLSYDGYAQAGDAPKKIRSINSTAINIIPRFAAIYKPHPSHIIKFLYGGAKKIPSFIQQFPANAGEKILDSETIQTIEIDYLTYLSPRYLLNLNLFSNELQDLMVLKYETNPDNSITYSMSNSGYWKTRGLELSLHAQPTDAWELESSLTYQTTEDRDNPKTTIAYSPHWLGQLKIAYRIDAKTKLALTGYYVSKMESSFDPTQRNAQGNLGTRIGAASDAHFVLGTNIRVQDWWMKGTFANLRIYNLLDTEIRYPITTENSWADKGLLGSGRTFMLNVGYQF